MKCPPCPVTPVGRTPPQVPYIIGNEACERFSFYGMRNILTPFLVTTLLLYAPEAERAGIAKNVFHTFVIGVYFFPLLGGWISDRFFGKYNTVFWLSLVYVVGHACLAIFEDNRTGFYTGLVSDRARVRRNQAARLRVRRRSIRPDEQGARQGRLRRVLLDDQLRFVLRFAPHADLSPAFRPERRVRHSRHLDGDRDVYFLARSQQIRARPARAAESGFVPARGAHRVAQRAHRGNRGPAWSSQSSARCWRSARSR